MIFLAVVLVGLNAASFVQKQDEPDTEAEPNRSTYNYGATGTRAFYDLLAETGRRPTRWLESPSALLDNRNKTKPSTFVVVGKTRRVFTDQEIEHLLRWVSTGGRLVVIDREPPEELIKTTANWLLSVTTAKENIYPPADPSDARRMTAKTAAAKPVQPSRLTADVNAVQASRFASTVQFEPISGAVNTEKKAETAKPPTVISTNIGTETSKSLPPPPKSSSGEAANEKDELEDASPALAAPIVYVADKDKNLLVGFPFGSGEIVFLTDPYVVSNGGISLVDNAQLAVNIAAQGDGAIAFDEFHQGFGEGDRQIWSYFAGTPIVSIFLQALFLTALVFLAQSRRFARPIPEIEANRLAKLEYVSAMAELQRRTRAFDLAIENIYGEFRRRAARRGGVDNMTTSHGELAKLIAERAKLDLRELENLLFKCEDIIRGEPTGKKEILQLTKRLREVEEKLGIKRAQPKFFKR